MAGHCSVAKGRSTTASAIIPIILLAAGGSRRLGLPKQLVEWRGTTLLRHAASAAIDSGVGPVLVVLGAESAKCAEALGSLDLATLTHAGWGEGVGSTIRVGVQAARRRWPELTALMLMSCDQPDVNAAALRQLAVAHASSRAPVVASAYAGTVGIPALFAKSELHHLEALLGDRGAKPLLASRGDLVTIPLPGAEFDVDLPTDLD